MAARTLGRYQLERKLAMGGMAEIWLARQDGPAGFEKQIVVKRILPHLVEDPKFTAMFLDEARLAAKLTHPNIVQIFDLGEVGGEYFIAMEFIDGRDVQALLERALETDRTIPPLVAARIIADAATALDYAHNFVDRDGKPVQLVHRDVSPQNILLSRDGIVKLVDFGVAKATTSSHKTQTGAVKGKLSYMAPEQISGKAIDARTDVFALGIVLYELVTGRRPFGHESELLAITAILNEAPPRPCAIVDDLPPSVEAIILRALEKRPEDRFQSASEMHVALEQVLREAGTIITSRDLGTWMADLFSATPTGFLASTSGSVRWAGVTDVAHPSSPTRPAIPPGPGTTDPVTEGGWVRAERAAATPPQGHADEASGRVVDPTSRPAVAIAVVVALIALLAGAAFMLVRVMQEGRDAPQAVAPADRAGAAAGPTAGEAADSGAGGTAAGDTAAYAEAGAQGAAVASAAGQMESDAAAKGDEEAARAVDAGSTPDAPPVAAAVDAGEPPAKEDAARIEAIADVPRLHPTPGGGQLHAQGDAADAVAAETGTIRVVVSGGRHTVYIDNERVGTLPGSGRYTVPSGTRSVRVVRDDGVARTERVEVRGGQMQIVRVQF